MKIKIVLIGTAMTVILAGCGGGGGASTTAIDGTTVFPSGMALASPVSLEPGTTVLAARSVSPFAATKETLLALLRGDHDKAARALGRLLPISDAWAFTRSPAYIAAANRINALLTGASPARTTPFFNANKFLSSPTNAGCYGPTLKYQNHPDGTDPADPTLPSGDLGIWTATDAPTGHVCAAAQLDARMDSITQRANMGLMTLASMINVASVAGKSLPAAGGSLTLTSDMNSTFPGLGFTSATVSQSSSGVWTYTVQFSFTDASVSHDAEIKLTHTPGADRTHYNGLLSYAVTRGSTNMLNCPVITGGTVDVGTLKYTRSGAASATLVQREGSYCGTGVASSLATSVANFSTDGQLDPTGKWDGSKGWGNNFNRFGASYDPTTSAGSYAFGWQAGYGDGNSRLFNIGLNYNAVTEVRDGESYFGFGNDISTSNGQIQGFICNWAGPGNSHTLQDYFQRQHITFNDTLGKWEPTGGAASSSNITYAPTNSCAYAGGTFLYDRNLNNTLGDDTVVLAVPDLKGKTFGSTTYASIPLAITARGMVVPSF